MIDNATNKLSVVFTGDIVQMLAGKLIGYVWYIRILRIKNPYIEINLFLIGLKRNKRLNSGDLRYADATKLKKRDIIIY